MINHGHFWTWLMIRFGRSRHTLTGAHDCNCILQQAAHVGDPSKIPKTGGDCAVNGKIKPRTGIVCGERVVCAWNGWCFAENGLLGFPAWPWWGVISTDAGNLWVWPGATRNYDKRFSSKSRILRIRSVNHVLQISTGLHEKTHCGCFPPDENGRLKWAVVGPHLLMY